jgi:YegS/Rv2252/BmrU family lipid kinase
MKPRVTFIVNRKIKQRKQIIRQIEKVFYDYPKIIVQTEYRYHAMLLAGQLADSSDFIIAVGGDGTVNEVVNGLMDLPDSSINKLTIGVLPAGTGDDFARNQKLKLDVEALKQMIDNYSVRRISIGVMKYVTTYGKNAVRYFVNIGEVGLGANTVRLMNYSPKLLGSSASFIAAALQVFVTFKYPYVKVISDAVHWQGRITLVAFANSQYFAGGLGIAPGASPFDDKLKLVIVEDIPTTEFIKNIPNLKAAKPIDHPKIHYFDAKNVIVEPADQRSVYVETDGEFLGVAPVEVSLIPSKLNLLIPNE